MAPPLIAVHLGWAAQCSGGCCYLLLRNERAVLNRARRNHPRSQAAGSGSEGSFWLPLNRQKGISHCFCPRLFGAMALTSTVSMRSAPPQRKAGSPAARYERVQLPNGRRPPGQEAHRSGASPSSPHARVSAPGVSF